MNFTHKGWFWLAVLLIAGFLVYELGSVLTPFVAGMVAAYLLNPLVGLLERKGVSRTIATALVTFGFCIIVAVVLVLVAPVLFGQLANFARRLPQYVETLRLRIMPLLELARDALPADTLEKMQSAAMDYVAPAARWLGQVLLAILGGGVVLANLLSLLLITPIVTFYLLDDWNHIVAKVDSWLPRDHAETIRVQVREVDRTLAGFLRGQSIVCLTLACFYGIGLSIVGLDFGLALGMATGLISFIPYFGMGLGLVIALALALVQFATLKGVVMVASVFVAGQILEGYVLTPRLVGGRVRLTPAWIIFALLAGGALFGFVGIMLAVPLAAIIGVGVRFMLQRYLESPYYLGHGKSPGDGEGREG